MYSPSLALHMGVRHLAFVLTHKESAPRTGGAKNTPNPPPQPQALPNSRLHILGGFEYPIIKQERAVAPVRRRAPDQGTERQATGHRLPTIRATCTWTWRTFSRGAVIFAPAPGGGTILDHISFYCSFIVFYAPVRWSKNTRPDRIFYEKKQMQSIWRIMKSNKI